MSAMLSDKEQDACLLFIDSSEHMFRRNVIFRIQPKPDRSRYMSFFFIVRVINIAKK